MLGSCDESFRPMPEHVDYEVSRLELSDKTVEALLVPLLSKLLEENDEMIMPSWEHPASVFYSTCRPNIDTEMFIRRMLHYSHCSRSAFIMAVVYLTRITDVHPFLALNELNVHRLFISALLLAAKTADDCVYSNAHYARVGGIRTVQEMNRLEGHMLNLLQFRTFVYQEEYASFVYQLSMRRVPHISRALGVRIARIYENRLSKVTAHCLGIDKSWITDGGNVTMVPPIVSLQILATHGEALALHGSWSQNAVTSAPYTVSNRDTCNWSPNAILLQELSQSHPWRAYRYNVRESPRRDHGPSSGNAQAVCRGWCKSSKDTANSFDSDTSTTTSSLRSPDTEWILHSKRNDVDTTSRGDVSPSSSMDHPLSRISQHSTDSFSETQVPQSPCSHPRDAPRRAMIPQCCR